MDIQAQMHEVVQEVITFVHNTDDNIAAIEKIVQLTRSLLYVIDTEKATDYKMAIVMEYLEGIQKVLPSPINQELYAELSHRKLHALQAEATTAVQQAIEQYINPHLVTPTLVVFWLKRTCSMDELKKMDTFMLMLSKDQQAKVMERDVSLSNEEGVQRLLQCLGKI